MFDGWKDSAKRHVLGVAVTMIDFDGNFVEEAIGVIPTAERDAEPLFSVLALTLDRAGLDIEKMYATCDRGEPVPAIAKLVRAAGRFFPCLAHLVQRAIASCREPDDGQATEFEELVAPVAFVVKQVMSAPTRTDEFVKVQRAMKDTGVDQKLPLTDSDVRWDSTCDLLERFLKHLDIYKALPLDLAFREEAIKVKFYDNIKKFSSKIYVAELEELASLLVPIRQITKSVSEARGVTVNLFCGVVEPVLK